MEHYIPLIPESETPLGVKRCEDTCVEEIYLTGKLRNITHSARLVETKRIFAPFGSGIDTIKVYYDGHSQGMAIDFQSNIVQLSLWDGKTTTLLSLAFSGIFKILDGESKYLGTLGLIVDKVL